MTTPDTTTLVVSFSELNTYRQCPLKHLIAYKNRWTKPVAEGGALARGTLFHQVMETHYLAIQQAQTAYGRDKTRPTAITTKTAQNRALESARAAVAPLLVDSKTGEQTEDQALIRWMYDGYCEHWGCDPNWVILGVEERLELPLFEGVHLKAKIDLRVYDTALGGQILVDHKSGKNLPSTQELQLDDQFGLYTWLLRETGVNVLAAMHNAVRTQRNMADFPGYTGKSQPQTPDQRMHRTWLNRTDVELDAIARDARAVVANAYPSAAGYDPLPIYSSPNPNECGWKCEFREAHMLARTGTPLADALVDQGFQQDFTRH